MNLIAISLRRTVFAWILMAALITFGGFSLSKLGVSQLPDVDFPIVNVSFVMEGANPEVVEEQADEFEESLLSIEGVKEMRTSVSQGTGNIRLEFDINRNVDVALQEVQTALGQVRLPTNMDPPVVRKQNPEEDPIMFLGLTAKDKSLREMLNFSDEFLIDQFRFIKDIGEVSLAGFSKRNLRIYPHLDKLRKADLTVMDVVQTIESQHMEAAAGQYVEGNRELRVRWLGQANTPEEMGNLRILTRGGSTIQDAVYKISDVADVYDDLSDIRRIARIQGVPAVSFSIRKQRGSNEVELADRVLAKVKELQTQLPEGYELSVRVNFTSSTRAVVNTTMEKLLVAAAVTIVICFLFLGSFQAAVNILFSIPTSIVGTFLIIYFCGFTLNLFTLLALTLAISIVVDDAIMLLENIVRHYRMGKNPYQAAYDGSMEILPAATAATLAVVAVFAPVIFMSGITGKFFFQFGVAMSAAVLLSLLEAVTITPMRAAAFMSTSPKVGKFEIWLDHKFENLAHFYQRILAKTLRHSGMVVVVSLVLFCASMLLVRQVRQEFLPPQDQNIILMTGQLAPGTSLEATAQVAEQVEKVLQEVPEIGSYLLSVGGGPGATSVNQFTVPISLIPREDRKATHLEIMDRLRAGLKGISGLRISLRDISSRGLTTGRQFPISMNLMGPDLKLLNEKAQEIIKRLESEGLAQDMDTDFRLGIPELEIEPLRQKLASRGVSVEAVANTLNVAVAGMRVNTFTSGGRRYDIRVKVPDNEVTSRQDIQRIGVRNQFGNIVQLGDLVKITEQGTVQSISRINRQRAIGVYGQLTKGQSQAKVLDRASQIAREVLPAGYTMSLEGASAGLTESFKSLTVALLLGILVAYMVLAVQFNSFIHPISVLVALPFSVTGALLALWAFNVSLNLFSFIGLIVLMGIAKKNSILLVEFTNKVRHATRKGVTESLLEGCPVRLRPILMTSVATVVAATPLIFGNSLGQETRTPMGLTIVGGTILSTILTLFVVPSLYKVLSRLELKENVHHFTTTPQGSAEPPHLDGSRPSAPPHAF
ncbi:MAG: efflux RND transporter permease subunit [Bdellovibrionales bacterium]|nr:efflux RND transporter permease subunit [Bdellovibrionales bacterium]